MVLDGSRFATNETFELAAGDELVHAEAHPFQRNFRAALVGQRALGCLNHVEHLQAIVAAHQGQQRLDLVFALGGLGDLAQDLLVLGRLQLQNGLPVGE